MKLSTGDTVVVTIDFTMKLEEYTRSRESSRDHYGKRGMVIHGALIKYRKVDGSYFKRVYYTSPGFDGVQDAKAALALVDVIVSNIKK